MASDHHCATALGVATDYLGCLLRRGARQGCQGVAVTGAVAAGLCGALNAAHGLHRDAVLLHTDPDAFGPLVGTTYRAARFVQDNPTINTLADPVACAIGPAIPGALNAAVYLSGFINPAVGLDEIAFGGLAQDAAEQAAATADRAAIAADPAVVSPATEGAENSGTGASSNLVPGSGLASHEAAGGHTLARHIGQTEAQLAIRLAAEPRIPAASSFTNRAIAEDAIAQAIDANQGQISAWLRGSNSRLPAIHFTANDIVGISLARGASSAVAVRGVRVVIVRDSSAVGWHILTAYPEP